MGNSYWLVRTESLKFISVSKWLNVNVRSPFKINLLEPTGYYTISFKIQKILRADNIAFMYSVWLSEETVPFALYAFSRLVL